MRHNHAESVGVHGVMELDLNRSWGVWDLYYFFQPLPHVEQKNRRTKGIRPLMAGSFILSFRGSAGSILLYPVSGYKLLSGLLILLIAVSKARLVSLISLSLKCNTLGTESLITVLVCGSI